MGWAIDSCYREISVRELNHGIAHPKVILKSAILM